MNAEGQLSDVDFLDIMVGLWRERFTGAARAENDAIIKIIYFREGDVLSASTNDRSDSLGEILLRSGKVSREHLKQGISRRKEEESLGEALLGLGLITRRELTWARRTQLVGAIRSAVEWRSGEYNIIRDYVPRRDEGAAFAFPQVLLEVILTRTDRDRVDKELELGSLVLEKRPVFDELYPHLNLNEEADSIVRHIDGRRSSVRIAVESDADRFNVFKLLLALKRLGLVGVAGEIAAVAGVEEEEDYPQQEAVPFLDPVEAEEDGDGEQEIERDPLLVETTPKRASEQIVFRDALAEETRPAAMTVPEVSRPGGTWRIPLLLLATIAILAAAAYIAGVLRPGTAPSPNARTARSPLAAVPAPPPIIIEATPIPSVEAEPTPMLTTLAVSVGTPLPALASPSPPPSPRPLPTPVPTAGAVIIAKLHTPAPSAEPAVEEPSEDPERARLDGMAAEFAGSNRPRYSVQFGIFCKTSSIANALQADPANVWFVPAIFRGERCYRAYWGRFEERAAVEQAISRLPEALRDGTRPTIASFGSE